MSKGATASQTVLPEYNPPVNGNVVIVAKEPKPYVDGDDTYTRFADVKLELFAMDFDGNGPMKICIGNSDVTPCTKWVAYPSSNPPTMPWKLSAGSGEKHVSVWFQDKYGNTTPAPASDTIILDTTKPKDGTLLIGQGAANTIFELTWSGFSDDSSGLQGYYKLVAGNAGYPACSAKALHEGPETSFNHEGLTVGKTYYYRVCTRDNVGNVSAGATAFKKVMTQP
jgi:hypothetical protein